MLVGTGHTYLPSLSWAAVVCGLAALIAGVAGGYAHRGPTRGTWRSVALAVVPLQVAAFVLVEVVERLASGASLGTLSPSLLAIGIAAQFVVGLFVAALIVGLRRVGLMLQSSMGVRRAPPASSPLPRSRLLVRKTWHQTSNPVRAPPASAAVL